MKRATLFGSVLALLLFYAAHSLSQQSSSPAQPQQPVGHAGDTELYSPSLPTVSFDFERKGVPAPSDSLTIYENGAGEYAGLTVPAGVDAASQPESQQLFKHKFALSLATVQHMFQLAGDLKHFSLTCASKAKNIADTGTKTLSYAGPDGTGACTYNYSENKDVQKITEIFQGIAETMDEGRELDRLHRYDRLGLDAAITFLAQETADGRALEIQTIETTLQSIASDTDVMERVRTRASTLLSQIPPALSH